MKRTFAKFVCSIIVTTAVLCACNSGGNRYANRTTNNHILDNTRYDGGSHVEPVVIHIDDNVTPLYDTISLDNMIADFKYVPLSSDSGSFMIGGCPVKVSDKYVMVSGKLFHPEVKIFNDAGQYERDAFLYGRGPNEVIDILDYFVDFDRKEIAVVSSNKILMYNIENQKSNVIYSDNNAQYSDISRLANGDYVLLPNNDYDDGRKEGNIRPALVFYDSLFQISDTLFRYTPKHRMIEGVTSGLLLGKVLRSGGNVTLYQDMAGDTVFRVSAERKLIPEFVIDIPDNLKMTVRESEKSSYEEKEKKITIRNYEVSRDYVCLSYHHDGVGRFGIWSKKTGQLLFRYVHPNDRHFIKVLLDGKVLEIPIGEFQPNSNSFVSSVPAMQMKHIFPNIEDDDNNVAIEITLKSDK